MRHLWQRIFAYSLALIIVSQVAVLLLHRLSVNRDEFARFASENLLALAAAVEGRTPASADAVARIFNRKTNRVWLENAQGQVVAGGLPGWGRPDDNAVLETRDQIRILEGADTPLGRFFVVATPVVLESGETTLFMAFGPPRGPGFWTLFLRGLLVLSFIGVALAAWMAWRVSRPLRTLRNEVMEIAGGNLDRRVTVTGKDEITDVAVAVNHMADNLARHIRSMRELVANISHEMRSPLARMQVSLALLEEDTAGLDTGGQTAGRLALLSEELAHMNKLIGATLLTSKLDLQGHVPMTGKVAFSELCAEMCRRQAPVFASRGVRFSRNIEPGIAFAGEETLLTNLVSNLLDNAAKYVSEGGAVSLILARAGNNALLMVENDHDPLPEDVLDHIFEPFYRGGIATGNGVGLGLSLVSKIAALHGGQATVANTEHGIRFQIVFPLSR